jgi:superfamily II DNA/RNA helicase
LVIRVGTIPRNKYRSYTALRFIFDPVPLSDDKSVVEPADIPKTIVFFNKKTDLHQAYEACLRYLERHDNHCYSRRRALGVVRVYTRNTHDEDKDRIIEELKKLAANSLIRVILATEALGIGVDLPDIGRVIQYGIIELPATLWQRGGRASRDGKNGEITLLLESWVRGDRVNLSAKEQASLTSQDLEDILRDPDQEDDQDDCATKDDSAIKKKRYTDAERRARLSDIR